MLHQIAVSKVLLVLVAILHTSTTFAEENTVSRQDLEAIIENSRACEEQYDNMHAVWKSTHKGFNGRESWERIEFWSREGKYFRVDGTSYDGLDGNVVRVNRNIVRPEGSITMRSKSPDEIGEITEVESTEEGLAVIKSASWFNDGNGIEGEKLYEIASAVLNSTSDSPHEVGYQFAKLPDGSIGVTFSAKTEDQVSTGKVSLDDEFFLIKSYESETVVPGKATGRGSGETRYTGISHLEYEGELLLPSRSTSTAIASGNGRGTSQAETTYTLEEVQLGPAPLELFYPDGFPMPSGTPWIRRIAVLLVGLAILAAYFRFRKASGT
ncbi:hypothetical protein [Rhodopirellula sallentina]|uniref:hypothetical protein n=1 Tax=Rhodopirellula sallentina TaxID=1263869 RepID=UPI0011819B9B|nr:hypothetical protein [Rhodopirellula sallentina]